MLAIQFHYSFLKIFLRFPVYAYEWGAEQLDITIWLPLLIIAGIRVTQFHLPIFWLLNLSQLECGQTTIIPIVPGGTGYPQLLQSSLQG